MSDLVKRLREVWQHHHDHDLKDHVLLRKAADLIEQLQQRIAELEATNKALEQNRDQYKREAYALAAHIERLKSACTKAVEQVPEIACILGFAEATQMKPLISLAEHDAEVARKAFIAGVDWANSLQPIDPKVTIQSTANEYAESIKRGKS